MSRKLCVIPGDGIGCEVTSAAVKVLLSLTNDVEIVSAEAGWQTFCEKGDSVPDETMVAIRDCGAALFGAVSSPSKKVEGYRSAILKIRQELDLYANLRPVKSEWSGIAAGGQQLVDLMIVRENSEGLYSGRERIVGDEAIAEKVVTKKASLRIGEWAARVAADRDGRVLIAHKANVLPISDGLFRDCVRESIELYSSVVSESIVIEEALADIVAHRLVASPEQFDVIVTTNMFGDILSDLAAHWCGGMGRAPSLNIGDRFAVAEPVHGSAPDIAGKGIADPTATVLALALLCRHQWNDCELAEKLEQAVEIASKKFGSASASTVDFTRAICEA